MNLRSALAAVAVLCLGSTVRAESVDDVLARMDAAAKQFHSYSANAKIVRYGAILQSFDNSSGTLRMRRAKNGVVGVLDETSGPDHTVLHFDGNIFEQYLPKANTLQRINVKKYSASMDQMLLLGFATTRDEIRRDYDVKLVGPETIDSVSTSHIILTPKSSEAKKIVKTIDLWIDPNGHALRQRGTEPDGDYHQSTFSDLKVNPDLPDSAFDFKPPSGTKVVNEN